MNDTQRDANRVGQLVRVVQPGERVDDDAQAQRQAQLGRSADAADDRGQRLAVQVLHRHREPVRVLDDLVGLNDVRMTEADGQPRLVTEHRDEVGIAGQVRPDPLENHQLAAFGRGQQHLRHATAADGNQGAITRWQWAREGAGIRVFWHHGHDCHGAKVRPAN